MFLNLLLAKLGKLFGELGSIEELTAAIQDSFSLLGLCVINKVLILNVISSSNHKHNGLLKGVLVPGDGALTATQHLWIKIPVVISLRIGFHFHEVIQDASHRQIMLLDHQVLHPFHHKLGACVHHSGEEAHRFDPTVAVVSWSCCHLGESLPLFNVVQG